MFHRIYDRITLLLARPYVAGDSLDAGMNVAYELSRRGLFTTLDLLAEGIDSKQLVDANREMYRQMVLQCSSDSRFSSAEVRPTVSVKLSSFTLSPLDRGGDAAGSVEAIEELAELARRSRVSLTIDMEDHHWTDFTLDVALRLFREGFDVGTVLQSRLHRTEQDLLRVPEGMRIRTVIGIYPEKHDIALSNKIEMKEALLRQSLALLRRNAFVEFASHDLKYIRRFLEQIVLPQGIGPERFEIQMLYGVPRGAFLRQMVDGSTCGGIQPRVRLYVPFASDWAQAVAYCQRRLRSNPNLAFYVARNLVDGLIGRNAGLAQYGPPRNGSPQ